MKKNLTLVILIALGLVLGFKTKSGRGADGSFAGYNFWLTKLNQFIGDFLKAEMVKAFLNSAQYRGRFVPAD